MKRILFFMLFSLFLSAGCLRAETYFSPGKGCENALVKYIETADTIDAAIYAINNDALVAALKRAYDRGAQIRILTDRLQASSKYSKVRELYQYGINIRVHSKYKIEHNKFAIFDDKKVFIGSYNWTNAASDKNSENCTFLPEAQTIQQYRAHFEVLWILNTPEKSDKWFNREP